MVLKKTSKNDKKIKRISTKTKTVVKPSDQREEKDLVVAPQVRNKAAEQAHAIVEGLMLPRRVVVQIADEVGKVVMQRLGRREATPVQDTPQKVIVNPIFLDTSAIIDGRVFELISIGVFTGTFVILESVLSELKNIADSKDETKKERGRKGMKMLDELKKRKDVGMIVLKDKSEEREVDDKIVSTAKEMKGKVVTCDYNLSKKAQISGLKSIDMYELANILKTNAVPGEVFFIKVIQKGKGEGQGVGYLPDGTMIVVESGEALIGATVKVMVSRIIQTEAGKIFFAQLLDSTTDE